MALLSDLINKVKKRKDEVLLDAGNTARRVLSTPVRVQLPSQHAPERFISNTIAKGIPALENAMVGVQRAGLGYASNRINQAASLGSKIPNINLRTGGIQRVQTPKINLTGLTGKPVTGVNPTAQRIGEGAANIGFSLAEMYAGGGAIKKLPGIVNAQRGLGASAGRIIAGNTLKSNPARFLIGKGVANMSQGLPYTAAYQVLNPKSNAKDVGGNLAFDVATGGLPLVGATFGGARAVGGKEQLLKKGFTLLADKKPRFEISDLASSLKRNFTDKLEGMLSKKVEFVLDDVLDHRGLFYRYPQLKNTKVIADPNLPTGTGGEFDEVANTIRLNPRYSPEQIKSSLLHEIQHGIQGIENFARGTNPIKEGLTVDNALIKSYKAKSDELARSYFETQDPIRRDSIMKQMDVLRKELSRVQDKFGMKNYKNNMAELEARTVSNRADLPDNQRYTSDPYYQTMQSEGLKPSDIIVNKGNGVSANQDLINEARKYKSAEEFVKAKATLSHRSITPDIKEFQPNEKGIFFTKDAYGERAFGKGDIHITNAYVELKKPFIANKENVIKLYQENYGLTKADAERLADDFEMAETTTRQQVKAFIEDKYDGMIIPEDWDGGFGTIESVVAFDPKQIKTKSQLTDIYNQSKGNVSASAEMPRTIKLKPQQAQSVRLNLKALPEPRGMVKGEGFTMYGKEYQDALKQGGKTIKIKQPLKSTERVFRLIERQEKPAQASLQAEVLKRQDPDIAYRIWRLKEDRIKASPIFQDGYVKSLMNKLDDTKQTPQQMSATLADIEKRVYGSATPSGVDFQKGTKSGAGLVSNLIRRGEAGVSGVVGKGLQSESPIVRNVSRLLQGFGGGLGKTRQATEGTGTFKGGVDYAQKISHDTQQYIAGLVGKDAKALERIHAVLDPDLAKVKVSFDSLTPKEKEATEFLRQVSDYINDTNYKNGFISEELWQSHRGGKYLARAYEPFDYAPEIADFLKQSRIKMDLAPFKQRTDINDWKVDNAIRDPAYLVAKRLQQTMFNDEVLRTFNWLKGTDMVSQTPKAGFVQLSDHKSYGELAGKFVRKDVLDDIKGLYFVNDFGNKVYDVLRAYDRNPVRQTQKQILTIFNPAVRLGNNVGNFFFAHLNGINPITFAKNRAWASAESKGNGQLYRRMVKDGLLGTDTMKADIANFAQKIQAGYKDDSAVKKIIQSLQTRYGNADDAAKLSAMKTWLDRGYSYEESARRVYNGFQNYRTVGWLYDVGSKLPIFGNPFVRFQGDLQRIIKNSVVDHPVRAVGTLMLWKLFTDVMSTASGETPEDRATRESRVGAPRVPFTKVALEVQTPWGAVNAGRLLGYVAYTPVGGATATSDLARVLPVQLPDIGEAQEKNNPRIALKNLGSAPDIGPVLSVLADTDFRGKSVSDPNQNRYQNSLLSDDEKRANQLNFLARQYIPYLDDVQDTVASIKGEKDYYGRTKTPTQALLRTGVGLKVEKFGAKEAQETRLRNQSYDEKANEAINKSISAVKKQLLKGEIDESTANKRIQFFKKQQTQQGTASAGVAFAGGGSGNYTVDGDTLTYLKDNGDLDSIDLNLEVPTPKQTGNVELDKKRRSAYYGDITAKINDIVKLNELGVLTDEKAEALIIDLQEQKDTFQSKSGGGSGGSSKKIKIASPPKLSSIKLATPKTVKLDILKNTSSGQRIKLPQMRPPTPQSPKKTVSVKSLAKAFEKYK